MKKVLSLLVVFVLLQTQSWALSGGPFFASSAATFTGTYSGVLIPQDIQGGVPVPAAPGTTAIGLFTLNQPDIGLASGTLTAFVNGAVFVGTIQGIIDPDNATLSGIIDAQSSFDVIILVPTTQIVNGVPVIVTTPTAFQVLGQGNIEAKIKNRSGSGGAPARITGTASLDVFFDIANDGTPIITRTAIFEVDGFKQVAAVVAL